jgi:hypothetical protein
MKSKKTRFLNTAYLKLANVRDSREFYQALSYFRPKKSNAGVCDALQPEAFHDFYSKLFSQEQTHTVLTDTLTEDAFLDQLFTLDELDLALKKLSTNKAPGSDCIPNEAWKCIPPDGRNTLLQSINDMWQTEDIPEHWGNIVMTPIFKKLSRLDPKNYRLISLVNTGMKLFTLMMTNRLNDWCQINSKISECQSGYKRGVGCEDSIFMLLSTIQLNMSKKRNVFALFVDLSNAFDSVCHDLLWNKLSTFGLSSKFISIIKQLYRKARAKVRTPLGESDYFDIGRGVLQGESLSAKLFTIFLEDIFEAFTKSDISPIQVGCALLHLLMYADDIVLLAYNSFDMQEKVNILKDYLSRNGLRVNLGKTKLMIFNPNNKRNVFPKIYWDENVIEYVSNYVYLGVPLHSNLDIKNTCTIFLNKAAKVEGQLCNVFYRGQINRLDSRLKLFDSLTKSVLLYAAHLWGINSGDRLTTFQMKFLKKTLSLPMYTPSWFVRLETNCTPVEYSLIKNCIHFWVRILKKPKTSIIRQCYDTLKKGMNCAKMKFNWARDLFEEGAFEEV